MQKQRNHKIPVLHGVPKPLNTPYRGTYVQELPCGTVKLFVNDYLIVSCPYGHWYWESPARNHSHTAIIEWFMQQYFPDTELRKPSFHIHGLKLIVSIKTREGALAK